MWRKWWGIFLWANLPLPEPEPQCAYGEFTSADGSCILEEEVCDGYRNCRSAENERSFCPTAGAPPETPRCGKNELTFDNGKCINCRFVCDGVWNAERVKTTQSSASPRKFPQLRTVTPTKWCALMGLVWSCTSCVTTDSTAQMEPTNANFVRALTNEKAACVWAILAVWDGTKWVTNTWTASTEVTNSTANCLRPISRWLVPPKISCVHTLTNVSWFLTAVMELKECDDSPANWSATENY